MKPILERLRSGDILVADGAMGTMLFQRGLQPGQCPESFNLAQPAMLEEIASLYLQAGADIVQTNTFGGSPVKLAGFGLAAQAGLINRSAVACVRSAVGERAYVSGSCGPSGEMLKPYGSVDEETLSRSFREQLCALIDAGVDLVCVETMTDLREASLAIQAAKSISPATPVMATMTFDRIPRGYYTIMGVGIDKAVEGLTGAGADIIGSNCGHGVDNMIEIARQIRALRQAYRHTVERGSPRAAGRAGRVPGITRLLRRQDGRADRRRRFHHRRVLRHDSGTHPGHQAIRRRGFAATGLIDPPGRRG